MRLFLARLFWDKMSRYCHHSGVVGVGVVVGLGVGVVGVTNFNIGHNFFVIEDILMQLHTLIHHHRSYILTKGHNSKMIFD